MKSLMKLSVVALAATVGLEAADACTAVIVGKKASATGYVLVAHNEDNGGNVFVRHAFVPAREYPPGDVMAQEPECAKLPQGDRSYAYFWSEVKDRSRRPPAGDVMCNENGVLVFSNNGGWQKEWLGEKGTLPDEESYSNLSEGGLGHNLRRTIAERARTAREGVDIATNLIARYGYTQASRIFTIADRDEAWVVEVIKGRRYVARRCPDDAVVVHPNCLSIREIRPDDIVSANIEPQRADFDFTKAYQGPRDWSSPYNRYRWKHLYDAVCGTDLPFSDYPFSVVPKRPVTAEMIKAGLRSHYEGTPDEVKNPHGGIPKDRPVPICRQSTLESFVCAFGATPAETVLSLATGRPCETPYVACRPFAGDLPGDCVCGDEAVERLNGHCRPLSAPSAVDAGNGVDLTLAKGATVAEKVWNFPVEKGTAVRFTVRVEYRAEDGRPPFNDLNVIASWVDARAGERHRRKLGVEWTDPSERDPGASWKYLQRDYVRHADAVSGDRVMRTFSDTINVPTNVVSVDVECFVKARPCEAKFLEVKAETVAALPKRVARIVLANPRRGGPSTIAARDRQVEKALDEVFAKVEKPDFVMACSEVFPESINKDPQEQSEPVPEGPTSRLLARYAKEHGCYVAGGLCEKDKDGVNYNAVVLFDRTGELVGKYRKVHLTTGEFLGGKRAGDAFPVFETDFGKVGFCICWDNFFPETMRQLQLNGAELVVFPIAATGADRFEHVFRARCIDTGLPLAIQIRQGERPNRILGRDGETLAETFVENEPCWADIDLAARTRTWWLSVGAAYGDPYQLYNAERRPDAYQ